MVQFSLSGEVAEFLDDNQFRSGESVDKCGPEVVALFWHSVAPGKNNPYHASDIHAMAHNDYLKYIGPDTPADHAGTDNATLYKMLSDHHFLYKVGPLSMEWVKGWLKAGYPVILGGVAESTVYDLALGGNPYNWPTAGLFHIILATGPGAGPDEILVRDTANIDHNGIVRPGPRHYRTSGLTYTTATMVVPSWMPIPGSDTPPAPTPPPVDWKKAALDAYAALGAALQHL